MAEQPTLHRPRTLQWLLLVCAVVAAFIVVHFPESPDAPRGIASNNSDAWHYHLAVRAYGFDRLREGALPLWNPYILGGQPFLATHQAAVLYPLNFPHWVLPHGQALGVVMGMHIVWATLGMFGWLRSRGYSPAGCAAGALVFGLAPAVVNPLQWPHVLLGNSWLPWVVWGIDGVVDRPTSRRGALLGLACTCLLLSGYVQGALYIYYLAIPYAALRWWQSTSDKSPRRTGAWLACGLLLFPFFASAVQMWPLLELVQHSARPAEGIDPRAVASLGHIPGSVIGRALIGALPSNALLFGPGVAAWLLISSGMTLGRFRAHLFWIVAGVIATCLAAGFDTPLYELYYRLPTGATFRLPVRLLLLTAYAAGVLTAAGVTALSSGSSSEHRAHRLVPILIVIVGSALTYASREWVLGSVAVALMLAWSVKPTWTPALSLAAMALVASSAIQRYEFAATLPWHGAAPFADDHQLASFLEEHRDHKRVHIYRRHGDWKQWRYPANWGTQHRILQLTGYESLPLATTATAFTAIDRDVAAESGIPFVGGLGLNVHSRNVQLLQLWAIEYVVVDEGISGDGEDIVLPSTWQPDPQASQQAGAPILRHQDALPRAYYVRSAPSTALPASMKEVSVPDLSASTVSFTQDEPEHIQLEVSAPENGFLVLHDAWYPGWEATIDGIRAPIELAYGLFRSVPVSAGSHTVTFAYRPLLVRYGLISSLAMLVVMVLCLVRPVRDA